MIIKADKNVVRKKRHGRVRSKLAGTTQRPRLNVFRSNKHIYAQLIDDSSRITLVSASTMDKEISVESTANVDAAVAVGALVAKRAVEKGITEIVFDRGGYLYHGRVKALADAARENGLQF